MGAMILVLAVVTVLYTGMLLGSVQTRLPRVFLVAGLICMASSLVIGVAGWLRGGFNWVGDAAIIVVFAGLMLVVYQYGYPLRTERGTLYLVSAMAIAGATAGVASSFVGR